MWADAETAPGASAGGAGDVPAGRAGDVPAGLAGDASAGLAGDAPAGREVTRQQGGRTNPLCLRQAEQAAA